MQSVLWTVQLLVLVGARGDTYRGDQVWKVYPNKDGDIRSLWELSESISYHNKMDFWKLPHSSHDPAHIHVAASHLQRLAAVLEQSGVSYKVMIDDLQTRLDREKEERVSQKRSAKMWVKKDRRQRRSGHSNRSKFSGKTMVNNSIVGTYAELEEINQWLTDVDEFFDEEVQKIVLPQRTYEGRELYVMKVGKPTPGALKPAIWVDGTEHAREWISPASMIYLIFKLLDSYLKGEPDAALIEELDWYIMPVANPDGYVHSHEEIRLWRKNKQPWPDAVGFPFFDLKCVGVDINRNFPFHWFEVGTSNYSCYATYCGPYAASENETRAMMDIILRLRPQLKAYFTVHNYGQMVMTRWGYNPNVTDGLPDDADLKRVGQKITDAMRATYGTNYTFGRAGDLLYPYSGGSPDWARAVAKIQYSYAFELRDRGKHGFLLPVQQSLEVGEEAYAGLRVMGYELIAQKPRPTPPRPTRIIGSACRGTELRGLLLLLTWVMAMCLS